MKIVLVIVKAGLSGGGDGGDGRKSRSGAGVPASNKNSLVTFHVKVYRS